MYIFAPITYFISMNIDFLRDGSDECPLIRLYNGQYEDYSVLIQSINNLIHKGARFDVLGLTNFKHDNSIKKFLFEMDEEDSGIIEYSEGGFYCRYSKKHLSEIIGKLTIYQRDQHGYYWLDEKSDIDILLSYSGRW